MTRALDLTPTWQAIMPALIAVIQDGTLEGQAMAQAELMRLARLADEANARTKAEQLAQVQA